MCHSGALDKPVEENRWIVCDAARELKCRRKMKRHGGVNVIFITIYHAALAKFFLTVRRPCSSTTPFIPKAAQRWSCDLLFSVLLQQV